ncbi:hypothetical protein Cgig2_009890 [Carnegiea gigantea]|uniref:Uncharacterized protein n=1 Tax=Carnegiea gigantea TaxID=171969 RepID=A0A9Q1K8S4_9CARY|nr:hypothetical protein Cgig2_009890 [Carnegiea gigantea]
MGFPHSLKTNEMALYALENFEWYCREVALPPLPLLSDYKDLRLDFDLAATEEAAHNFGLSEMVQVVFLAMLLNDAVTLGVLRGWLIDIMESALKELCWSIFQAWGYGRGLEVDPQWSEMDYFRILVECQQACSSRGAASPKAYPGGGLGSVND